MGTIISIHIAEDDRAALRPLQEAELVTTYSITTLPTAEIVANLTHWAGLRAQIVEGGTVRVADAIAVLV